MELFSIRIQRTFQLVSTLQGRGLGKENPDWLDCPDGSRVADRSVGNSPCFGAEHPDSQWHATFQSRRQADPDRNGENRMHAGSGHAGRRLPAPWRIQYGFYPGRVETV